MRALRTAASGMAAQQLNVEDISNNIANMNTVGYKRQRAEFQDLLYQNIERMGAQSSSQGTVVPTGIQVGAGVKAGAVYRITEQGTPQRTDGRYDMAIDGRGYFQILLPSGETAFTRAGNFASRKFIASFSWIGESPALLPFASLGRSKSKDAIAAVSESPYSCVVGSAQRIASASRRISVHKRSSEKRSRGTSTSPSAPVIPKRCCNTGASKLIVAHLR